MARPSRNNADYFTHYTNLKDDRRVKAIRTQFGAAGYGMLMMFYEALTDADGSQLNLNNDTEMELLAGDFGVSVTEINSLLQLGVKVGLFRQNETGNIHSVDLDNWLEPVFTKRNRSRAVAETRQKEASALKPEVSATETKVSVTETPQRRGEERIKKQEKKDAPTGAVKFSFPLNWTPSMISAYEDSWLVYRQKGFKTKLRPESIQKQITQLSELPEPQVIACINNSIANGYQGLILDKFRALNGTHINGTGTAFQAKHAIPD